MAKIQYIIQVTTSERDASGNCYHYACITRTEDGESIGGHVGGPSNPSGHLRELGLEWEDFKVCESVMPKRRFWQLFKGINTQLNMPELEKFTGIPIWHITDNGIRALCGSESMNQQLLTTGETRANMFPKLDLGVWCSDCRRASYYNQRKVG